MSKHIHIHLHKTADLSGESEEVQGLRKKLKRQEEIFNSFSAVGGPPRSHPVHAALKELREKLKSAKAKQQDAGEFVKYRGEVYEVLQRGYLGNPDLLKLKSSNSGGSPFSAHKKDCTPVQAKDAVGSFSPQAIAVYERLGSRFAKEGKTLQELKAELAKKGETTGAYYASAVTEFKRAGGKDAEPARDAAQANDIARAKDLVSQISRLLDSKEAMGRINASDLQTALGGLRTALNWIN